MSGAETAKRNPLRYAATLIRRATEEEHPDGNPLAAARFYTTGLEYIVNWAVKRAADLDNEAQRRYFLHAVRQRLELYHERATLLLQLAAEIGMLDKPDQSVLPPDDYDLLYPPVQTSETMPAFVNDLTGAGGEAAAATAAIAADKPTPRTEAGAEDSQEIPAGLGWGEALPPTMRHDTSKTAGDRAQPLAPSPPPPPPPPPSSEKMDIDELMKQLGMPK